MEILFEILFQALIWLLQVAGELLLQLLGEFVASWFGRQAKVSAKARGRDAPWPAWLAVPGYMFAGAAAGALSLWLMPQLFIQAPWLRIVNVLATPFLAAFVMAWVGARRLRQGKELIRLDSFAYGYCFAFAMAVVRYFLGR